MFISNVRWRSEAEGSDSRNEGIAWFELYVYYAIHGVCGDIVDDKMKTPVWDTEIIANGDCDDQKLI